MARRKRGLLGKIVFVAVLALACFGGYTLYHRYKEPAAKQARKIERAAKAAKKELARKIGDRK